MLGRPPTFYIWKKKYRGRNELRELRQLREENGKRERLVADLSPDLQEIVQTYSSSCAAGDSDCLALAVGVPDRELSATTPTTPR
jgi:hypothetical protein